MHHDFRFPSCTCNFHLTVTKDEFLVMAENLRIPMADSMKMVPAPWIPKEVVNMDDLYSELTLEKHNRYLFKKKHVNLRTTKNYLPGTTQEC